MLVRWLSQLACSHATVNARVTDTSIGSVYPSTRRTCSSSTDPLRAVFANRVESAALGCRSAARRSALHRLPGLQADCGGCEIAPPARRSRNHPGICRCVEMPARFGRAS